MNENILLLRFDERVPFQIWSQKYLPTDNGAWGTTETAEPAAQCLQQWSQRTGWTPSARLVRRLDDSMTKCLPFEAV